MRQPLYPPKSLTVMPRRPATQQNDFPVRVSAFLWDNGTNPAARHVLSAMTVCNPAILKMKTLNNFF